MTADEIQLSPQGRERHKRWAALTSVLAAIYLTTMKRVVIHTESIPEPLAQ